MSDAPAPAQPKLAHILFMDLVEFGKLRTDESVEVIQQLQLIVQNTTQVRGARTESDVVCLPTGDGMALVFFDNPLAPVQCAIEVARALVEQPRLQLRMGVNTGPVFQVTDINGAPNVSGSGINMAERVMSCGDANHILVSQRTAEILGELSRWSTWLQDFGEVEVKHGHRIRIFNLCGEGVGNPNLPKRLRESRAREGSKATAEGARLKHYQLQQKLGQGGMGTVFRALDTHLDRTVAIKVLNVPELADPNQRIRFVQEAKAASTLSHPNIVTVHDVDSDGGVDFIVMELVEGRTMANLIGELSVRDAVKYAIQIASALARAHAAGIVHRDIKPANVVVTADGAVKVLDFGLAKLMEGVENNFTASMSGSGPASTSGELMGTAAYMSPEQIRGGPVDGSSDIFSFGTVLYEMLCGHRPFPGGNNMGVLLQILNDEPLPLTVKVAAAVPELERIVMHCLRKNPADRPRGMDEVRRALESLTPEKLAGDWRPVVPAAAPVSTQKTKARWIGWAAGGVLGIGALAAWALLGRGGADGTLSVLLDPPVPHASVRWHRDGDASAPAALDSAQVRVPVGKYTVTASAPGYEPATANTEVAPHSTGAITLRLTPLPTPHPQPVESAIPAIRRAPPPVAARPAPTSASPAPTMQIAAAPASSVPPAPTAPAHPMPVVEAPKAPTFTLANWEAMGGWTREGTSLSRRGGNFVLAPVLPQNGVYEFSVPEHKGRLEWVINYQNTENYTLCFIDKKNFKRVDYAGGKGTVGLETLHNLDAKGPISVQITISPAVIETKVLRGTLWALLASWPRPTPQAVLGPFGFHLPGHDTLSLSEFTFTPQATRLP